MSIDFNQGGGPPKTVERHGTFSSACEAAPALIGKRPTATANGLFVRLCAAVVTNCGFGHRGIERAVERAIKELSKEQRRGLQAIFPKPPATPTESGLASS